nr:MAG TPA: hypothetical protein [Caudoviricetes sp.]
MLANEKNLIPYSERSENEARENGRKGGIASGESRRKRKLLKDSMNALLELPVSSTKEYNALIKMGIDIEDIDNSQLIVLALFNRAKSGDVAAIKELRNLIGEDSSEDKSAGQLERLIEGLKYE